MNGYPEVAGINGYIPSTKAVEGYGEEGVAAAVEEGNGKGDVESTQGGGQEEISVTTDAAFAPPPPAVMQDPVFTSSEDLPPPTVAATTTTTGPPPTTLHLPLSHLQDSPQLSRTASMADETSSMQAVAGSPPPVPASASSSNSLGGGGTTTTTTTIPEIGIDASVPPPTGIATATTSIADTSSSAMHSSPLLVPQESDLRTVVNPVPQPSPTPTPTPTDAPFLFTPSGASEAATPGGIATQAPPPASAPATTSSSSIIANGGPSTFTSDDQTPAPISLAAEAANEQPELPLPATMTFTESNTKGVSPPKSISPPPPTPAAPGPSDVSLHISIPKIEEAVASESLEEDATPLAQDDTPLPLQEEVTIPASVPSEPVENTPKIEEVPTTQVATPKIEEQEVVPPPASSSLTQPESPGEPMPKEHQKFASAVIRSLKRHPDAPPFLLPVDPIAQGVPDYPKYIQRPMDISTVEKDLQARRYPTADAFIADVRLIFANCYRFNGSESPISKMAKNVEEVFERQMAKLPSLPPPPQDNTATAASAAIDAPTVPAPASATPLGSSPPVQRKGRQESISVPTIRRSPSEGRPKREIHPPPPKDLPWALDNENGAKRKRTDSRQLRFCRSVLNELHKKSHETYAFPFYTPVDAVVLNLPDYHKVIKKPMDLSTMRKKLDAGAYPNADAFEADMQQMFKNCYKYNPAGTAVHGYGKTLEAVFKRKWAEKPEETEIASDNEMDVEESDASELIDSRRTNAEISEMEKQLEMMKNKISELKASQKDRKSSHSHPKSKPKSSKSGSRHHVGAGGHTKSPRKPSIKKKRKHTTTYSSDEDEDQSEDDDLPITFDQKRLLSEKINTLPENRLAAVVALIHEEMPHLAAQGGEIELEIEQLNTRTLNRLFRMVVKGSSGKSRHRSGAKSSSKRSKSDGRKVGGTSGLKKKRQILDEHEQQRQIKALEQRLKSFESGGVTAPGARRPTESESGDESSGVTTGDESASDSE